MGRRGTTFTCKTRGVGGGFVAICPTLSPSDPKALADFKASEVVVKSAFYPEVHRELWQRRRCQAGCYHEVSRLVSCDSGVHSSYINGLRKRLNSLAQRLEKARTGLCDSILKQKQTEGCVVNEHTAGDIIILRLPDEWAPEFPQLWDAWRLAEGLDPEQNLKDSQQVNRFDGVGLVEWVVPLAKGMGLLLTAAAGFLAARRGEVEIRRGGNIAKFRNIRPSDIKDIMKTLDDDAK